MRSRRRYCAFALTAALALVGAAVADNPNTKQTAARAPGDGAACSNGVQVSHDGAPRDGPVNFVQGGPGRLPEDAE